RMHVLRSPAVLQTLNRHNLTRQIASKSMKFVTRQKSRILSVAVWALMFAIAGFYCVKHWLNPAPAHSSNLQVPALELAQPSAYLRPLWRVEEFATIPGDVHSLLATEIKGQIEVYAGAGANGEVFRLNAEFPTSVRRVATGFGSDVE